MQDRPIFGNESDFDGGSSDIDSDSEMLHITIVSLPKNDIFSFFLLSKHKKTPPHGGASV